MPKTLHLKRAHQNKTGYLGVYKAWWPGDMKKPKNADLNGFKVILKHPQVKRKMHVRTFKVAEDAAKVRAAWENLTRGKMFVPGKTHANTFNDVFLKALDQKIHIEQQQAAVIDLQKITNLEEKKSLIQADKTPSASSLLAVATHLYAFE